MDVLSKTQDGLKQKAGLGRQPSLPRGSHPKGPGKEGCSRIPSPGKRGNCLMATETKSSLDPTANLGYVLAYSQGAKEQASPVFSTTVHYRF